MNCLRCDGTVLEEREREGVVIDVCPRCRGIWLDRGELEKLAARLGGGEDGGDDDDRRGERRRGRRRDDDDDDDEGGGGFLGSFGRFFD